MEASKLLDAQVQTKRIYNLLSEVMDLSQQLGQAMDRNDEVAARMLLAMIMMLGIFVGISFTNSQELFYNTLIMPIIGGLGYLVFRWKAVYRVPLLLLAVGLAALGLDLLRGLGQLDAPSLLLWTVIYSGFAMVGLLIAALLCFAFKKED